MPKHKPKAKSTRAIFERASLLVEVRFRLARRTLTKQLRNLIAAAILAELKPSFRKRLAAYDAAAMRAVLVRVQPYLA